MLTINLGVSLHFRCIMLYTATVLGGIDCHQAAAALPTALGSHSLHGKGSWQQPRQDSASNRPCPARFNQGCSI